MDRTDIDSELRELFRSTSLCVRCGSPGLPVPEGCVPICNACVVDELNETSRKLYEERSTTFDLHQRIDGYRAAVIFLVGVLGICLAMLLTGGK